MVPALSLLLALAAPPGAAARPSPDLPWLDPAGATPRWNHPLSLRLRLQAPAGDERPLPHHCLTPTLHYGAWPLPSGQLRWRIDTDPQERRSWLSLDSPLPVTEPWIDVAVDWHCGGLSHRQTLTLLVEPDWPGDVPAADMPPAVPGSRRLIAIRADTEDRPEAAARSGPMPVSAAVGPDEAAWQAVLGRLARLEAAGLRGPGAASGAAPGRGPAPAPAPAPSPAPSQAPERGIAGPPATAAATAATSDAAVTAAPPAVSPPPPSPDAAAPTAGGPASPSRPPRHAATEDVAGQALAAWPWLLLCAGLGWAWGQRSRASRPDKSGGRPRLGLGGTSREGPAGRSLPNAVAGQDRAGPWPAWFGAPTRPDAGAWLPGGLPRPDPVPAWTPAARPSDEPGPWNRGLSLSEVEIDAVAWSPTPAVAAGSPPGADAPPDPTPPETTTAAKAAVS